METIVNIPSSIVEVFLPEDTLKWFDLIEARKYDKSVTILLEEKNIPPLPVWYKGEAITSKGFKNITITDFPIRGRKSLLTFRRRYWQIEGQSELLKREIKLTADGTLLEKEFADFLKE